MSLSDLIRRKNAPMDVATATVATVATDSPLSPSGVATVATVATESPAIRVNPAPSVATVATVAVANPKGAKTALPTIEPLTPIQGWAIRAWLEHIGETDPEEIARAWERCRTRLDTRAYVLDLASKAGITTARRGTESRNAVDARKGRKDARDVPVKTLERDACDASKPSLHDGPAARCPKCAGEGCRWCRPRVES